VCNVEDLSILQYVAVTLKGLAQGLNLPAHLAILAGDKRISADQNSREDLEAHEILNAAARAGRAGHLANGVVILIPEPIIIVSDGKPLEQDVIRKLKSVFPEDDRCVTISDPLEIVLDRLMQGDTLDVDVRYTVSRMAALRDTEDREEPIFLFDLRKSLGAFWARKRQAEAEFEARIAELKKAIAQDTPDEVDNTMAVLASQSGLSMDLILRLKKRVTDSAGSLPATVEDWLIWTVQWLAEDENACAWLLHDVKRSVLGACGVKRDGEITAKDLALILPGLLAWIKGRHLAAIEKELGGDPNSSSPAKMACPRARHLVGSVIPRAFSFIMGLISHVIRDSDLLDMQADLSRQLIECLGTAVRKGYDTPEKVLFAGDHPSVLSRVQVHELWTQQIASD
jgi:hypothetical protein